MTDLKALRQRKSKKKKKTSGKAKKLDDCTETDIFVICRPGGKPPLKGHLVILGNNEKLVFQSVKGVEYFCWDAENIKVYKSKNGIGVKVSEEVEKDGKRELVSEEYNFKLTDEESETLERQLKKLFLLAFLIILSTTVAVATVKQFDFIGYIHNMKQQRIMMEMDLTGWTSENMNGENRKGVKYSTTNFIESDKTIRYEIFVCNRPENIERTIKYLFEKVKRVSWDNILILQQKSHRVTDMFIRNYPVNIVLEQGVFESGGEIMDFDYAYGRGNNFRRSSMIALTVDDNRLFMPDFLLNSDPNRPRKDDFFMLYANEVTCKDQGVSDG